VPFSIARASDPNNQQKEIFPMTKPAPAQATIAADPAFSNSLTDLAARIRVEHEACDAALKRGLQHAVAAGKLLIEAKAQLKHGQWLPWLREHCGIPERSARRYMQIAPYAVDDDDRTILANLADLTADAAPVPKPFSERWFRQMLDGPFTELDFEPASLHWMTTKLMHQAEVPALVALMLADDTAADLPLLRLCGGDDLEAALIALAPFADRSCVKARPPTGRMVKIDVGTVTEMQWGITLITLMASWLLGKVLHEIDCRRRHTDEDYQREWDETHAAWMARLDAQLAKFESKEAATAD
jgi:hypothetical protein